MSTLPHSLRLAWRAVRGKPLFTTVSVLTLALGIGANGSIFSIVYGVLMRPLPFEQPEGLVLLVKEKDGELIPWHSGGNFLEIRRESEALSGLAAYQEAQLAVSGGDDPVLVPSGIVSADLFQVLRAAPALGRAFGPEENEPGATPVAMVGYGLWRERYGGDPEIVGREITVEGRSRIIVGVMPQGFDYPAGARLWVPLEYGQFFRDDNLRGANFLRVVGRLDPGIALPRAAADIETIGESIKARFPHLVSYDRYTVVSLLDYTVGDLRSPLLVLLGAVGFVLLIVCANVANLMLSRGVARRTEVAVRAALGASRARLIGQTLIESLVLAILGGLLGLLIAAWATEAFVALGPDDIPRLGEVRVDGPVIVFTAMVALLTTLVFGALPALYHSSSDIGAALRTGGRGMSSGRGAGRLRSALVVSETALAAMLLVGAALLARSLWELTRVDPGFRTERGLSFSLSLPFARYGGSESWRRFYRELLPRLESIPGVRSAEAASQLPLQGRSMSVGFGIEGETAEDREQRFILLRSVTRGYFASMGIPLLRGRGFDPSDEEGSEPVAILSHSAARRFFPDADPLGRTVGLGISIGEGQVRGRVIGVVGDVMATGLDVEPEPHVYMIHPQLPLHTMTIVLRTDVPPGDLLSAARAELSALDPQLPVARVRTLDELLSSSLSRPRFYSLALAGFAGLALAMAAAGIFGVLSYSVTLRRPEIGIRIALGARPADVLKDVVGQGMRLALAGLGLGMIGASLLSRSLRSVLFRVQPLDAAAFTGAMGLLLLVALLAAWWPARRATKLDPTAALRLE